MKNKLSFILISLVFLSACWNSVENPLEPKKDPETTNQKIIIDIQDGLLTKEDPTTPLSDTFTIVLGEQPDADVTIGTIISSDTTEVTVTPGNLTFTSSNWDVPQTVTVTGVDDLIFDNYQTVTIDLGITTSTSADWNNIDPGDIFVYNLDDEVTASAGVLILTGDGLITDETGTTDTFTVVLTSAPTANVNIPISSLNTAEVTVSPASLTFTTANYDTAQTVTVTGINDVAIDGTQSVIIDLGTMTSTDANYNFDPGDATAYNLDDEIPTVPGVTVYAGSDKLVSENGDTSKFEVVLNSPPTANVTILVTSGDITEGTVSPASLIFTTANWATPQTVTVTGVNDAITDGNISFTVNLGWTASADANYNGTIDPPDVNYTNIDNETPGITVNAGSSMLVSESMTSSSFTIVLNSQPAANVTIGISTDDPTEGTITSPFSADSGNITFTTGDWNIGRTVTVEGVNDNEADGNQNFNIVIGTASSTDGNYNGINPDDIAFTNVDDDIIGITIKGRNVLVTDETGLSDTCDIVLNSQPTANVTLSTVNPDPIFNPDPGEVSFLPTTITFTPANWNTSQQITVTGVNDAISDGEQIVVIDLGLASSTDTNYDNMDPGDLTVYNLDDESPAQIMVFSDMPLVTTENGGEVVLKVILNKQPAADVTLSTINSLDTTEGTIVSANSLTFTSTDWNSPHIIRVRGQQDPDAADTNYDIDLGTTSSTDPNWNAIDPGDVSLVNKNLITVDSYSCSSAPGGFSSINGTGNLITFYWVDPITPYSSYDEGYFQAPIGFPFNYMGKYYSDLMIYTDGFASFSSEIFNDYTFDNGYLFAIYDVDEFNDILAPWWDDLSTASGAVYFQTTGTVGNRIFTVEWNAVYTVGYSDDLYFQIKLYESTNKIEFIYSALSTTGAGSSASIGLNDNAGMDPSNYWFDGYDDTTGSDADWTSANYSRGGVDFPANNVITFTP